MFTQPLSSPPAGHQASSPVSPSRPSRLRGLSYLRNYTHSHLLSRDGSHHSASPSASASNSSIAAGGNLTRSASYTVSSSTTTTTTTTTIPAGQNVNRLTLVNSTPDSTESHARTSQRSTPLVASSSPPAPIPEMPTRTRSGAGADVDVADQPASTRTRTSTAADTAAPNPDNAPSIRLSAYYDPRSTRPSLSFPPISRTLPHGGDVIRVGRYSERDGQAGMAANQPSAAPVGFKSKVVSRRHCEFWSEDGKWFIRDVKSSSGTFLNHIRLSPPSQESKAYAVNDGDIVQLGIDFKGGEEMIFRCVKMRLELNRGWQNKPNTFNVAAHKRLRTMASNGAASTVSSTSQDCSICLNSIAPCQSLFVAPCSHTWHFKCVRSLLSSPQYPIFFCPNCRASADLEADVDEPDGEWQQLDEELCGDDREAADQDQPPHGLPASTSTPAADLTVQDADGMDVTVNVAALDGPSGPATNLPHAATEPLPIRNPSSGARRVDDLRENRSPSPVINGEGPITPRNNAGPWVFDGSAGQRAPDATPEMRSLDAAAGPDLGRGVASDDSSR
ncbi:FHA domain containing protein [Drechmeria coniospora]|uniref:RING-type E3 ubiquitin transferase n=1 Tax=Drechmeria coniospora TaxID=98403 RepID=A0A151GXP4_DRECN|nr:FHA domain containing protein [Drechmeria coniospora]KYK61841.1 FHA domain containing protein [Drechmeria coniospora]